MTLTYGRYELRAKIDIRSGSWPAWWLWSRPDAAGWPGEGEIDMMEYYRGKCLFNIMDGATRWYAGNERRTITSLDGPGGLPVRPVDRPWQGGCRGHHESIDGPDHARIGRHCHGDLCAQVTRRIMRYPTGNTSGEPGIPHINLRRGTPGTHRESA